MHNVINVINTGELHSEDFQPCLLERHQIWSGDTFLGSISFPAGDRNRPENAACYRKADERLRKIEESLTVKGNDSCYLLACESKHASVSQFMNWIESEGYETDLFDHRELDSKGDNPLYEIVGNLLGVEDSYFHIVVTSKYAYNNLVFAFVYSDQANVA